MNSICPFSELLEEAPDASMPLAVWKQRLGAMFEVAKPFLFRPGTVATCIPHPADPRKLLSIRRYKQNWLACDPHGRDSSMPLMHEDIVNWCVDWDMAVLAYCDALGLQRYTHAPTNSSGWKHIGKITREGGALDLVALVIAATPASSTAQLQELLCRPDVSTIFSISRIKVDSRLQQMAAQNQVRLLQLTEMCAWQNGTLVATAAWKPLWLALKRRRAPDALQPTSPRSLERDGACWRFSFEGEHATVNDLVGVGYIRQLIQSPHKRIGVLDLLGTREPVRAELIRSIPRERCEDHNELEQTPEFRSVVIGVRQGITRTLKEIKSQSPLLYAHFHEHLHTGMVCTYSPPPGIDWELQ
jgi:hypothetical protein